MDRPGYWYACDTFTLSQLNLCGLVKFSQSYQGASSVYRFPSSRNSGRLVAFYRYWGSPGPVPVNNAWNSRLIVNIDIAGKKKNSEYQNLGETSSGSLRTIGENVDRIFCNKAIQVFGKCCSGLVYCYKVSVIFCRSAWALIQSTSRRVVDLECSVDNISRTSASLDSEFYRRSETPGTVILYITCCAVSPRTLFK